MASPSPNTVCVPVPVQLRSRGKTERPASGW